MNVFDSSGTTVIGDTGSRERVAQTWPSEATLVYKAHLPRQSQDSCALAPVREDSLSSAPSDGDLTGTVTATVSEMTAVGSKGLNTPPGSSEKYSSPSHYSIDRITSVLDALESHVSESQQKMQVLEAEPDLILCDEVTSALDTVVAAAVLDLMAELRRELGVSYLFISHDLHTVRAVCDEIVVMQHGRKLAQVARCDYERGPHHPYYELLARSVPELRQGWLDDMDRIAAAAR